MPINSTPITHSMFDDISNTVCSNSDDLVLLTASGNTEVIDNQFPQTYHLCGLVDQDCGNMDVLETCRNFMGKVTNDHNVHCTLFVYYPESNGSIGWHTNDFVNYYNAICTYSETGNGQFEYIENDETITIPDTVGWTVKKSYWSNTSVIPHRVTTNSKRITVTFSSHDESDVDAFIDVIT